jgi:hypothetical protein
LPADLDQEVSGRELAACPPYDKCVPNFVHRVADNEALDIAMKMAKLGAQTVLLAAKMLATSSGFLPAAFVFGTLSTATGIFWPSSGPPDNPCTGAVKDDWAKCVWQQVFPFVKQYVDMRLDEDWEKTYMAKIDGVKTVMMNINQTVYDDSVKAPNGTVISIPNNTAEIMYNRLLSLHDYMTENAHMFLIEGAPPKTGIYLAQWATLHCQVMVSLFGGPMYRTKGFQNEIARTINDYATYTTSVVANAKSNRLNNYLHSSSKQAAVARSSCQMGLGLDVTETLKDDWPECSWVYNWINKQCPPPPVDTCKAKYMIDCNAGDKESFDLDCFKVQMYCNGCMKGYVQNVKTQQNKMWQQTALGAIPMWLDAAQAIMNTSVSEAGSWPLAVKFPAFPEYQGAECTAQTRTNGITFDGSSSTLFIIFAFSVGCASMMALVAVVMYARSRCKKRNSSKQQPASLSRETSASLESLDSSVEDA